MPSRNIVKQYSSEAFYHIYTRGVAKEKVFIDDHDYLYFLNLLKRYLSAKPAVSKARVEYPSYGKRVDLLAFCLMPNHIHLLLFQKDPGAMPELLRSVMTSYSMYFNKRHSRVGPVFQSRYRASLIEQESYLQHISRYIHLNPKGWQDYPYSSQLYYAEVENAEWIKPAFIKEMFDNSWPQYQEFLQDYESQKAILDELKWELANEIY